ncbi:MAG TPA: DUF465 domain-containing protein [Polyangiaceae bacterium]|jgi:hypothetical protein|nr:DUF465 domain-containing protein [Polyangiaceae bacterium]
MSEGQHDLAHEFPENAAAIHRLKSGGGHFARLADDYHEVCKELHRIESGVETPADEYVETLKLKRLHLKDEIAAILRA